MSTPGEMLSAIGRRLGSGRSADEPHVFRGRSVEELIPRIQRELGPRQLANDDHEIGQTAA